MSTEAVLLSVGALLLMTVLTARLSERLRIPSLLLFLLVGMLAGSEGPGGITFDSPGTAQAIGTVALAIILFAGGLDTQWAAIRPVLAPGLLLATAGVVVTAALVGTAAWWLLGTYTSFEIGSQGLSWPEALLLGVIVSSTDAAALFALFRGGAPLPRPRIRNLLELESGTNDPTAVILTTTLLGLLTATSGGPGATLLTLTLQIVLGTVSGYTLGWAGAALANRLNMQAPGLYPILVLALGLVTFGLSDRLGANPFLAVYVAGVVLGNTLHQQINLVRDVTDALSWLAQIVMFLSLGLLVIPSHLVAVAPVALALSFVLMLFARPVATALCLAPFHFDRSEIGYIAWAGLKGAVPIVLATFPATYGLQSAGDIYSVVFVIVVVSVLAQGLTLQPAARRLRITSP